MTWITSIEELEAHYGTPKPPALVKVADYITPQYRAWIEASSFCALATVGPEGTDCSPRGDAGKVAVVADERTLHIPDRRGNDRIDTLRNIVRDPRVSLMFLIPGSATVIRINGAGRVNVSEDLLAAYEKDGKRPRSVIVVSTHEIYFQCARAVMRADLWNESPEVADLPSPGDILSAMSDGNVGGPDYDREWPARAQRSMW